jgi:hypothetical protein
MFIKKKIKRKFIEEQSQSYSTTQGPLGLIVNNKSGSNDTGKPIITGINIHS